MKNLYILSINRFYIFFLILINSLIFCYKSLPAQSTRSGIEINAETNEHPLSFLIYSNALVDVNSITIEIKSNNEFSSFNTVKENITIVPLNNKKLEIFCKSQAGSLCFISSDIPLLSFMVDSATFDTEYEITYLNFNSQEVFSENVNLRIPSDVLLSNRCSKNFINLNTGVGLANQQVDPNWITSYNTPVYVVSHNWPVSSSNANWVNYYPYNSGRENDSMIYIRKICSNKNTNGNINLCIAADNSAKVYFNNQLIAQTTNGNFGFMQFSCFNNIPVNINQGENVLKVSVSNLLGNTGFIITNSSLVSNSPSVGLLSDSCCSSSSRICGRKIWDKNCNGKSEAGDIPLSNWPISLMTPDGNTINTITDNDGNFCFDNLLPGQYILSEQLLDSWTASNSSGPFYVSLEPYSIIIRDFLNCKPPKCEELFTELENSDECCQTKFVINNHDNSGLQSITYSVSGGVINSITSSHCNYTSTPANLNGTSTGTINFNSQCTSQNPILFFVNASSSTASGNICITWNANYEQGGQTFSCSYITCINCERAPKFCNNNLNASPNIFAPTNTDYRKFIISNLKLPTSPIKSIKIKFINEPNPNHIGGGLVVDGLNRNWTYNNSGGPTNPYTKVDLACTGQEVHGPSAVNSVELNLGVDKTLIPPYSGIVSFEIVHCDGDTCELNYTWEPPVINNSNSTLRVTDSPQAKIKVLDLDFELPEGAQSFAIMVGDTTNKILATTPPAYNAENEKSNLVNFRVVSSINKVFYQQITSKHLIDNRKYKITLAIIHGEENQSDKIKTLVTYFDATGREIAFDEQLISGINIGALDSKNSISFKNIMNVYPNPTDKLININLTLDKSTRIILKIADNLGNEITNLIDDKYVESGNHNYQFDLSTLPSGLFQLVLNCSGNIYFEKFIISR